MEGLRGQRLSTMAWGHAIFKKADAHFARIGWPPVPITPHIPLVPKLPKALSLSKWHLGIERSGDSLTASVSPKGRAGCAGN